MTLKAYCMQKLHLKSCDYFIDQTLHYNTILFYNTYKNRTCLYMFKGTGFRKNSLAEKVLQTIHSNILWIYFPYLENCSIFERKCQLANPNKSDVGFLVRVTQPFYSVTRFFSLRRPKCASDFFICD